MSSVKLEEFDSCPRTLSGSKVLSAIRLFQLEIPLIWQQRRLNTSIVWSKSTKTDNSRFTADCWASFISVKSGLGSEGHTSETHETDAPPTGISVAKVWIIARVWIMETERCVCLNGNVQINCLWSEEVDALTCSAKKDMTVKMTSVTRTQCVQNFSLSRYTRLRKKNKHISDSLKWRTYMFPNWATKVSEVVRLPGGGEANHALM